MFVWPMARHRVTVTRSHPLNPSATPSPHLSLVSLRVSPPYAHVLSYRISVVSSVALSCRIWIYRYICVWACFSFCFRSFYSSVTPKHFYGKVALRLVVKASIVCSRQPVCSRLWSVSTSSPPFSCHPLHRSRLRPSRSFWHFWGFCRFQNSREGVFIRRLHFRDQEHTRKWFSVGEI